MSRNYFVVETKSTKGLSKLCSDEKLKIKCGEKYFAVIEEIEYNILQNLLNWHNNIERMMKLERLTH